MTIEQFKRDNPMDVWLRGKGIVVVGTGTEKTTNVCAVKEHKEGHQCVSVDVERGIWNCNDCGCGGDMIRWMALEEGKTDGDILQGLHLDDGAKGKPEEVASYDYVDEEGRLLFQCVRYVPKNFKQRRPDASAVGGWVYNLKGVRRVLFRLPQVMAAKKKGVPICVCEGEKDVLAMVEHGFEATCNPMGAKKWDDGYTAALEGADVILIPDKDVEGRAHRDVVAARLAGRVRSLKVVECPNLNGSVIKDAADYFAHGGEASDLDALAEAAPPYIPGQNSTAEEKQPATIIAKPLAELMPAQADDPSELLKSRYLSRGGGLLFCGPTGIGKSVMVMQAAISWAAGQPFCGIVPCGLLSSLIIQAENDEAEMAEMRDGILDNGEFTDAVALAACKKVHVYREDSKTGKAFFEKVVRPLLAEHKPDMLWIDPALAYLGAEANAQKDVSAFLRNQINPIIREFNCGVIIVHHTNKPTTGKEKPDWKGGDFAYLGAGSAEWANWARAVLAIRSLGDHDQFELHAGKRGNRIGWVEEDGKKRSYVRYVAHAEQGVYWREVGAPEESDGGAPKKYQEEEIFSVLPPEGLRTQDWIKKARIECGVSEATLHRARRQLLKDGRISKSVTNEKWQPCKPPPREGEREC